MEYADNGDLFQQIQDHQKAKTFFAEQDIWKIFIQVVRGLKSMHDLNIMHRDLKSANVFLNKDFTAKLGDMNVSKVANKRGLNYTQTGTPYYASPEVWRDEPYDVKSDIWSLGCVLYEMIALKPPFTADDMEGLYKCVTKGHFPRIPKNFSHDLWQMVKFLLQVNPQSRPSCEQIMSVPTFAKRMQKFFGNNRQFDQTEQNILLKTIKFPPNLMYLSDKLPKQNYSKDFIPLLNEDIYIQNQADQLNHKTFSKKQSNPNNNRNQNSRLPSIQNVKQIYMNNHVYNHVRDNQISQQQQEDGIQPGQMILASSPIRNNSKQKSLQRQKDSLGAKSIVIPADTQSQNNLSVNDMQNSPDIDETLIEVGAQNGSQNLAVGKKKASHQLNYNNYDAMSEEGQIQAKSEISKENQQLNQVTSEQKLALLNQKNQELNVGGGLLPSINQGQNQYENDSNSQYQQYRSNDNRDQSPILLRNKPNQRNQNQYHSVSMSVDYQQKKILSNQPSTVNYNLQKVLGAYQVNPPVRYNMHKQVTVSPPHQRASLDHSESKERLRASPQRVQDILNRYNIKNLKQNLKYGVLNRSNKNRPTVGHQIYGLNHSINGSSIQIANHPYQQSNKYNSNNHSLMHNPSNTNILPGQGIDQNKSVNYSRVINEADEESAMAAQSTIGTMKNNMNRLKQVQHAYGGSGSNNSSSLVLPKLENSFGSKQKQQDLSQIYSKGNNMQSPRVLDKKQHKRKVIIKNKSNFEGNGHSNSNPNLHILNQQQ
eukprot:403376005